MKNFVGQLEQKDKEIAEHEKQRSQLRHDNEQLNQQIISLEEQLYTQKQAHLDLLDQLETFES